MRGFVSVIDIRRQAPIRKLISECFYDGELQGGREKIDPILCGYKGRAINWLSTKRLSNRTEQQAGTSYINSEEVARICTLLRNIDSRLRAHNAKGKKHVLVLSGYEQQLKHLNQRIGQIYKDIEFLKIECCTVDRAQGREADIVLFSVTRSNKDMRVGFLKALERINVALSRTRELLYIIGDDSFVIRAENNVPLQMVLNYIRKHPEDCHFGEFTE